MTRDDEQRLKVRANYLILKYTWNYLKGESTLKKFFEWIGIDSTIYSKIISNHNISKTAKENLTEIKYLNGIPKKILDKRILNKFYCEPDKAILDFMSGKNLLMIGDDNVFGLHYWASVFDPVNPSYKPTYDKTNSCVINVNGQIDIVKNCIETEKPSGYNEFEKLIKSILEYRDEALSDILNTANSKMKIINEKYLALATSSKHSKLITEEKVNIIMLDNHIEYLKEYLQNMEACRRVKIMRMTKTKK